VTTPVRPTTADSVLRTRNAVALVFGLNGFAYASLVSRVPDLRERLALDNGGLGLLLLAIAVGSVLALPSSGPLVARLGTRRVVRAGTVLAAGSLVVVTLGAGTGVVGAAALGLGGYGAGVGLWDVAMNVQGAGSERALRRPVMPRFHAAFSFGSVLGAGAGALVVASGVPLLAHLGSVGVVAVVLVLRSTGWFVDEAVTDPAERTSPEPRGGGRVAWAEPRTLALGLMVLAFAMAEGTANDWLSLALIDGYDAPAWLGVAGFALFVVAMTSGRLVGPVVLARWGRARTLWATAALSAAGVLALVHAAGPVVAALGIVVWGLGASLGFPVGMSAASDDPTRAAARVAVVSTVGYGAFLAGPPLLGRLGDAVGTLDALQVVAALMAPAALAVLATRASTGASAGPPAPTARPRARGWRAGRG